MSGTSVWQILKGTVSEFMEDNVLRLAAALAYYAMFSLGPLLVIVIAIASFFLEKDNVQTEVVHQIESFVGPQAAETVKTMFSSQSHESTVLATVLGTVGLLFGATGVFGQLQDALNTIWEVRPKSGQGVWGFIRTRFLSFTMVLGIGFLLLISMVITTVLEGFSGRLTAGTSISGAMAQAVNLGSSFLVVTLLFAMIFRLLPDVKVKWRDVWIGAIGTSILFSIGKFLIGMYLGRVSTSSAYGAAGSVVVILLWVYYSSLILFFGAEFTQVYAKATGSRIVPSPNAESVTEEARAEQGIPHTETSMPHSNGDKSAPGPGTGAPIFGNSDAALNSPPPSYSVMASVLSGFVGGWLVHRELTSRGRPRRLQLRVLHKPLADNGHLQNGKKRV